MNAATIGHILQTDPYTRNFFRGFIFQNTRPIKIASFPSLVILNTDTIQGKGEHWCVAFFPNSKECEYFDSFGDSPELYSFSSKIVAEKIRYNRKQVQGINQLTCGHHCIYFSVLRCRNIPFQDIVEKYYTDDLRKNDYKVFRYVASLGSEYANPISTFHQI